jgi:hypothetical protein
MSVKPYTYGLSWTRDVIEDKHKYKRELKKDASAKQWRPPYPSLPLLDGKSMIITKKRIEKEKKIISGLLSKWKNPDLYATHINHVEKMV